MKNANMPAMPNTNTEVYPIPCPTDYGKGLTKREMFAMAAMQGILARAGSPDRSVNARLAVEYADALLKELEK